MTQTKLPASGYFTTGPSGVSAQNAANALNDIREFISQMPGGWAPQTLTISNGIIQPSTSFIIVDTEASASSDNLDIIDPVNMFNSAENEHGRILFIRIADNSRNVTIRNAQGGTGQILTYTGGNIKLDVTSSVAMMIWDPSVTSWRLFGVLYGDDKIPHRLIVNGDSYGFEHRTTGQSAGIKAYRDESATGIAASFDGYVRDSNNTGVRIGSFEVRAVSLTAGAHSGKCTIKSVSSATDQIELEALDGVQIGNPTGGRQGLGTINATDYYVNGTKLTYVTVSKSGLLAMPGANSSTSWAHGLSSKPDEVSVWMECIAAEGGYSVGDRVDISTAEDYGDKYVFGVSFDATNVTVSRKGNPRMVTKDGSANFVPTTSGWNLYIIAKLYS